jgi:hypothetical protein
MSLKTGTHINPTETAVLQHLQRHGQCNLAHITTAVMVAHGVAKATVASAVYLNVQRGLMAADHTRPKDIAYTITAKGRQRLAQPDGKHLPGATVPKARYNINAAPVYRPETDAAPYRPGSMDAYALPSRVGNRLIYPPAFAHLNTTHINATHHQEQTE